MTFFRSGHFQWRAYQTIRNQSFLCGYCGDKVASDRGYKIGQHGDGSGQQVGGIYICPNCYGPDFMDTKGV